MGQSFGSILVGLFLFVIFQSRLQSRCWLALQSSEGLMGARKSASKVLTGVLMQIVGKIFLFLVMWTFPSVRFLECLYNIVTGFLQANDEREHEIFSDLVLEPHAIISAIFF